MISSLSLFARDFVVIQDRNCQFYEGLVIGIDENVHILTEAGFIKTLSEKDISTILTYGINRSPFSKNITFESSLINYFRKIEFREENKPIIGLPFQYIENLIFILTDKGKMIVVGNGEISNISTLKPSELNLKTFSGIKINPDFEEKASECDGDKFQGKGNTTAIRVLGDNLKISEYLNNYRVGQRSFRDLEERTSFYFKPYLFPKRNRMGIIQINGQKELALPFFYQWSTGEDFHFQSQNQFGGIISKYLPSFEKSTVFTSEFKSHFFHGYFEGNLTGLSAGNIPQDFSSDKPKENIVVNNFNYMAFMGGDWKNFSFSYGGGYFSPYFNMKGYEGREVAANAISTALRFGYQFKNFKINFLTYFLDDKSSSSFDVEDQINVESKNSLGENDITGYEYGSIYYRLNFSWQALSDLRVQTDLLLGKGEYEDDGTQALNIEHETQAYLIQVQRSFGHYVTLTLLMKSEVYKMESSLGGVEKDFESDNTYYGGRFELLF